MANDPDPLWDSLGDSSSDDPLPGGKPAAGADADPLWDNLGPQPDTDPLAPASTPKPAGPPRLRGQARTPPPPPRPAPGPPRLRGAPTPPPPKQPDPTLSQALQGAQRNLIPSAVSGIQRTVTPFLPQNWISTAQGLGAIGTGLLSRAGIIDQGNAAAQAQHQAPIHAISNMYRQRYGTWGGFKRTLMNDPFAIGSDIATAATLPLGIGELGAAAKVGGVAGDVLGAVGKAGRLAQLADPTVAAAEGIGLAGRGVGAGLHAVSQVHPGLASGIGKAVRGGVGAAAGSAIGAHVPFVGPLVGGYIGERAGEALIPKFGMPPGAPNAVSAIGRGATSLAPTVSTVSGMLPMSPAEQASHDAELQGQGGGAPAVPTPTGGPADAPPGDPDNDTIANQIMYHEGGLGGQKNPGSSAQGPFQLTGDTWVKEYRRQNPRQAAGMTDDQIKQFRQSDQGQAISPQLGRNYIDYEAGLVKNLGMPVTARNVYTIHFLGERRGPRLLQALEDDPSVAGAPITDYLGPEQLSANPQLAHLRTVGDFLNWEDGAMQDGASKWARAQSRQQNVQLAQGYAAGGQVVDLTERLMRRAERESRTTRTATKPLLGLDDNTVARALAVANRAI